MSARKKNGWMISGNQDRVYAICLSGKFVRFPMAFVYAFVRRPGFPAVINAANKGNKFDSIEIIFKRGTKWELFPSKELDFSVFEFSVILFLPMISFENIRFDPNGNFPFGKIWFLNFWIFNIILGNDFFWEIKYSILRISSSEKGIWNSKFDEKKFENWFEVFHQHYLYQRFLSNTSVKPDEDWFLPSEN